MYTLAKYQHQLFNTNTEVEKYLAYFRQPAHKGLKKITHFTVPIFKRQLTYRDLERHEELVMPFMRVFNEKGFCFVGEGSYNAKKRDDVRYDYLLFVLSPPSPYNPSVHCRKQFLCLLMACLYARNN